MGVEIAIVALRLYVLIGALLILNLISTAAFVGRRRGALKTLFFIPIWPLAIFSPKGRKIILNEVSKI